MEELFRTIAEAVALGLEIAVVITVTIGAVEAISIIARAMVRREEHGLRRGWLRFATWVLISLEFALGADLVETAIAPTWDDIGMLGAIAAIRTVLGYFLGRDIAEAREMEVEDREAAGRSKEA